MFLFIPSVEFSLSYTFLVSTAFVLFLIWSKHPLCQLSLEVELWDCGGLLVGLRPTPNDPKPQGLQNVPPFFIYLLILHPPTAQVHLQFRFAEGPCNLQLLQNANLEWKCCLVTYLLQQTLPFFLIWSLQDVCRRSCVKSCTCSMHRAVHELALNCFSYSKLLLWVMSLVMIATPYHTLNSWWHTKELKVWMMNYWITNVIPELWQNAAKVSAWVTWTLQIAFNVMWILSLWLTEGGGNCFTCKWLECSSFISVTPLCFRRNSKELRLQFRAL